MISSDGLLIFIQMTKRAIIYNNRRTIPRYSKHIKNFYNSMPRLFCYKISIESLADPKGSGTMSPQHILYMVRFIKIDLIFSIAGITFSKTSSF